MTSLVEKVGATLFGQPGVIGEDQIRNAITVVLREMYRGRQLDLAGNDYTKRWRDTILAFARREDIDEVEVIK